MTPALTIRVNGKVYIVHTEAEIRALCAELAQTKAA